MASRMYMCAVSSPASGAPHIDALAEAVRGVTRPSVPAADRAPSTRRVVLSDPLGPRRLLKRRGRRGGDPALRLWALRIKGKRPWEEPTEHTPSKPGRFPAHELMGKSKQIERTAGLRSAARNNKATRLLTRPGPASKSSARDSSRRAVKLRCALADPPFPRAGDGL